MSDLKYSCNGGFEHDFSNEDSEYCTNGCGEKESVYIIKSLNAEIKRLEAELEKLKRANEIAVKVLEAIATSSQKDEFLSDVEYRHRISGIYFSSEKALAEIKGIL